MKILRFIHAVALLTIFGISKIDHGKRKKKKKKEGREGGRKKMHSKCEMKKGNHYRYRQAPKNPDNIVKN